MECVTYSDNRSGCLTLSSAFLFSVLTGSLYCYKNSGNIRMYSENDTMFQQKAGKANEKRPGKKSNLLLVIFLLDESDKNL